MRPALYPVLFGNRLRPVLDLLFTSGVLDPRVTYSGASLATLTNAAGAIAYKPHNLLLNSVLAGGASGSPGAAPTSWAFAFNGGSTTVGSQSVTLAVGSAGRHNIAQSFVLTPSTTYTLSFNLTAISGTAGDWFALINVPSGSISGTSFLAVSSGTGAKSLTFTAGTGGATIDVRIGCGTNANSTGAMSVTFDSVQLNVGPLQPYYPTTSAAYFGPRFTYDPVTLSALGLLIEEQRTNLLTYSEQVDNAAWVKTGCTITAGAIAAPDGNTTADLVVATGAPGSAYVQTSAPASTSGTATFSVYAKAGTRSTFNMTTFNGSPNTDFDLSTASKTDKNGAVGSITHVGGGWYRCVSTVTLGAPSTQRSFLWSIDGIYLWGAQLEAGAFATSYIPTTSASVTRAADSAVMTGSNFSSWFNAAEGTFFADMNWSNFSSITPVMCDVSDATAQNQISLYISGSSVVLVPKTAGVNQAILVPSGAQVTTATSRAAGSYKVNDFRACSRGGTVASDFLGDIPTGLTQMGIGRRGNWNTDSANAPIARLRYYPVALTNAQLQALTT